MMFRKRTWFYSFVYKNQNNETVLDCDLYDTMAHGKYVVGEILDRIFREHPNAIVLSISRID